MRNVLIIIMTLLLSVQNALASKRTDDILNEDIELSFQKLAQKKEDIKSTKQMMQTLQAKLKEARKGKETYIKIRTVAGTLAIVAIAVGAYKLTFPSGIKLTGLRLMLSSYLAVSGVNEGMIKLNQSDIENLSREIILSLIKISKMEKSLAAELKNLCRQDPRDRLCYDLKN